MMYFDEFVQLTEEVTSEFMFAILDTLYQYVPCIQNFCMLKANYTHLLKTQLSESSEAIKYVQPTATVLAPPLSDKALDRATEYIEAKTEQGQGGEDHLDDQKEGALK